MIYNVSLAKRSNRDKKNAEWINVGRLSPVEHIFLEGKWVGQKVEKSYARQRNKVFNNSECNGFDMKTSCDADSAIMCTIEGVFVG